jgi:hypothetical protein
MASARTRAYCLAMASLSKANVVALLAFAFGALVYGPGNAFIGHHDHGAHHHHDAASGSAAAAAALEVPAHCLFCLDGIAPQPTELIVAIAAERRYHVIAPAAQAKPQRRFLRRVLPPCRAPPSSELIASA